MCNFVAKPLSDVRLVILTCVLLSEDVGVYVAMIGY